MIIDEHDFRKVSAVVKKYNKYNCVKEKTVDDIYNYMLGCAYANMHTANYFSTMGFVLTAYKNLSGEIKVRASVSHSLFDD